MPCEPALLTDRIHDTSPDAVRYAVAMPKEVEADVGAVESDSISTNSHGRWADVSCPLGLAASHLRSSNRQVVARWKWP